MKVRTHLGTALAAAALMALPLGAAAQTTTSSQSGLSGQSGTSVQSGTQTPPYGQSSSSLSSPSHYLDEARKDLDNLSPSAKEGQAGKDLERYFNDLRTAYQSQSGTSSSGSQTSGTSGTTGSGTATSSDTWRTNYNKIQQILDSLNVPKSSAWVASSPESSSSSGSSSSTSGTSGSTSGTSGSSEMSGTYSSASLEAADLAQLKQFREDIEMFHKSVQQQMR